MTQLPENLEKKIFYSLAGIFLILLPILSLKSGISGDEETFHYPHGKNVFKYYASLGKDTTCLHYDNSVLHMYGPVFDLATVVMVKILKPYDDYTVRHIMNSIVGWTAIFFAGLIAVMLGGWRAGIITLIFMFLSPRFLGHSFNNPKDIPFTAAYIFTIYAIIRFLRSFPENKYKYAWPIALGIGLAIGVRVGGILLAVYFVLFAGIYYLFTTKSGEILADRNLKKFTAILKFVIVICIGGYFIGVLLWPYAQNWHFLGRTKEAMIYMEKYGTSLKQVFEGKFIWSDNVPVYYLPKYILMTIPEFVILGFIAFFVFINKVKRIDRTWIFILLFTSIFPVIYIIYKKSNVYGGWRHVMFIYPGLVILAALGTNMLINAFKNKYIRLSVIVLFGVLILLPLRFIIKNHPLEYIYYNSISGGVKKAYGNYEMDYFYHSLRPGSDWLIKNKIDKETPAAGKKIIVATNHAKIMEYYFRNYTDKVKVVYIRYYERGNSDWDYAILANSYVNPYQLKKDIWPPANTIHTIDVDGKPVCAILQRKDKSDLNGYNLMSAGKYAEAVDQFNIALSKDQKYDNVYYNLAETYLDLKDYKNAMLASTECLKLYPDYDRALNILGMGYLNTGQLETALGIFIRNIKKNPKYVLSYYYAAVINAQSNELDTALKYLQEAINVSAGYKPSYYLMARIYEMQGKGPLAKQITDYANSIP
jgi:tetratricopeptide (TPR) repeat protein